MASGWRSLLHRHPHAGLTGHVWQVHPQVVQQDTAIRLKGHHLQEGKKTRGSVGGCGQGALPGAWVDVVMRGSGGCVWWAWPGQNGLEGSGQ